MAGRGFGKTRIGAEEIRKAETGRVPEPDRRDRRRRPRHHDRRRVRHPRRLPAVGTPTYQPSKRQLEWPSGAKSLIFTADEPERLRGKQHEWLWADEVAAWRYPEAWDQAMLGLRLGEPAGRRHDDAEADPLVRELIANTTLRRHARLHLRQPREPRAGVRRRDHPQVRRHPPRPAGAARRAARGRRARLPVQRAIHVIPPFDVPTRSSGSRAWTSALRQLRDRLVRVRGRLRRQPPRVRRFYEPGLPSETHRRSSSSAEAQAGNIPRPTTATVRNSVWADPAIFNPGQTEPGGGSPPSSPTSSRLRHQIVAREQRPSRRLRPHRPSCSASTRHTGSRRGMRRRRAGSPRLFIFDTGT
jgi:hypothetical protein